MNDKPLGRAVTMSCDESLVKVWLTARRPTPPPPRPRWAPAVPDSKALNFKHLVTSRYFYSHARTRAHLRLACLQVRGGSGSDAARSSRWCVQLMRSHSSVWRVTNTARHTRPLHQSWISPTCCFFLPVWEKKTTKNTEKEKRSGNIQCNKPRWETIFLFSCEIILASGAQTLAHIFVGLKWTPSLRPTNVFLFQHDTRHGWIFFFFFDK